MTIRESKAISEISLLCAILVVIIHIGDISCPSSLSVRLFEVIVQQGICKIAVPFFFVFAGYFLSKHVEEKGWYGREVRKRVGSLLLPMWTWGGMFGIVSIALQLTSNRISGRPLLDNFPTIKIILTWFGLDPLASFQMGQLWFLRSLFLLVVLSPVLLVCLRRIPLISILVVSIAYLFFPYDNPSLFLKAFKECIEITGLLYFMVGMLIRFRHFDIPPILRRVSLFVAFGLLACSCILEFHESWLAGYVRTVTIPVLMYAVWANWRVLNFPAWLTGLSFPIYLTHWLVLTVFGLIVKDVRSSLLLIVMKIAFGVVVSGAVSLAIRKWLPSATKILYGGR